MLLFAVIWNRATLDAVESGVTSVDGRAQAVLLS